MEVGAETASLDAHRAELQQEADDLRVECDDLRRQVGVLQTVFEEQHGEFMTLMSRVMALRVRRGEWLDKQAVAAANNNNSGDTPFGGASSAIRPTGCDSVDALLRKVELALNTISTSGSTLLQQLDQAATNAMELPTQHNAATRLHSNNAKATRTTNVIVTTTEEVRGVRAWAKQHAKECKRCAAEGIAGPPNTRATKQQQHTGVKAAPPLRHIAASRRKPFARASISLRSEPSFATMDAHGTERVDLLRWKMRVEVANSATGEPVSDVAEVAKSVMALTNQWLSVLVRSVLEKLCSDAPWLREPHQNPDLHGPILFALQSAKPRTTVVGQTIACTEVADDDGGSSSTGTPSPATSSRTFLDFLISFSIPLHVPCMAPLLELLLQPAQRTYLVEHVVRPLATHISNALGFGDVVGRYTTTAATALDVIFTMANQDGMLDGTAVSRTTTRLYHVLLCLATFGSTLRVEAAAPRKEADEGLAAYCLHLARAALNTLRTPQPLILPPGPVGGRSDAVDVVVQATRLPTTFLEILNQTFSSSERLPASARSSTMDLLLSPKTKLSIGLKMYSELYINLCRPYGPATGAITEQMKNSSSGANKAPPCVPVVMRVSDDAIAENIALGAEVEELLVKLAEVEARIAATTQEQKAMLEKGQSMLVRLAEELLGAESEDAQAQSSVAAAAHSSGTRHYVSELKALNIRLSPRCGAVVGLDLILPFGLTTVDVATCTTPLIYLAVDGVFAPACGPHPNT